MDSAVSATTQKIENVLKLLREDVEEKAATLSTLHGVEGDAEFRGTGEVGDVSEHLEEDAERESVGGGIGGELSNHLANDWGLVGIGERSGHGVRVDDGENVEVGIGGFRHAFERAEGSSVVQKVRWEDKLESRNEGEERAEELVEANVGNAADFGEFQRRLRRVLERPLEFSHLALVFEHFRWNEHEFTEQSTDGGVVSAKNQKRDSGD